MNFCTSRHPASTSRRPRSSASLGTPAQGAIANLVLNIAVFLLTLAVFLAPAAA